MSDCFYEVTRTIREKSVPKQADQRELVEKVGGVFRLCSMVQKRMRELVMGARPLVEVDYTQRRDLLDIVMREIDEGKIGVAEEGEASVDIPMLLQTDVPDPAEDIALDAFKGVVDEDDLAVVVPAPEESQNEEEGQEPQPKASGEPEASDGEKDNKDEDEEDKQPEEPSEEPSEETEASDGEEDNKDEEDKQPEEPSEEPSEETDR